MDARTKGLLTTLVSVVLCGCPGLILCIFGGAVAFGAPVNTELNGVSNTTQLSPMLGVGLLCVALLLIAIPIAVAFFSLRTKPTPPSMNEPMPPTS